MLVFLEVMLPRFYSNQQILSISHPQRFKVQVFYTPQCLYTVLLI